GITGAGIALDATARGYRVGLIERGDFASGTSSWSTKLAHGGIRYLPQFDLPLVREALVERGRMLRNAPHLTRPLAFVLPLYAGARHPIGLPVAPPFGLGLNEIFDVGLALYDALAGHENVGRHRRLSQAEVARRASCLTSTGLRSGFLYYDAQTDDVRLTLAVLRAAVERGALIANYCAATGFEVEDGRIVGVSAHETLPAADEAADVAADVAADFDGAVAPGRAGARITQPLPILIRARYVVNATGVWAERTERLSQEAPQLRIAPSKGAHLVFARETLGLGDEAIVLPETQDGRIIFVVPWRSRALVGTTDTPTRTLATPVAEDADIEYLLGHLNHYLRRPVSRADIISTYAGYRPLLALHEKPRKSESDEPRDETPQAKKTRRAKRQSARANHASMPTKANGAHPAHTDEEEIPTLEESAHLSRTHALVEGKNGLLTISGGKLTTYRRMAQDVLDRIDAHEGKHRSCPTIRMKVAGAEDWAEARMALALRGRALGLDGEVIVHLGATYGADALGVLALVEGEPDLGRRLVDDLPAIRAEVVWACRADLALTLEDTLARRTHLSIEDRARGLGVVWDAATLMADELGWSAAEVRRQVMAYCAYAHEQAGSLASDLPTLADVLAQEPEPPSPPSSLTLADTAP
ncbi:MAG TPA: glycerol-3-phosphate dehydrogenase/oxidase, partial [Ktedonobacterales bacterium]|nr:glycerol-3-phosphate dehydrogenase/oxidase [Ktedonobacterales bacterium]